MDLDTMIALMASNLYERHFEDTEEQTVARAVERARRLWQAVVKK